MATVMTHRGPDGHGAFVDDGIALGHRRLSIIDVDGGVQPMTTQDGRYTICYNGEVYNYVELREQLKAGGYVFQTQSDTEVVLALFARDGVECLKSLNGMFAFAVWDREKRTVFLARDRLGIKPLYYTMDRGDLVFASEMKGLFPHPGVQRDTDLLSLSKFLTYMYVPAPHTIYRSVAKLEPGPICMATSGVGRRIRIGTFRFRTTLWVVCR